MPLLFIQAAAATRPQTLPQLPSAVLVGLENVGKSTLFRLLSGEETGEETNFRGSTVTCREASLPGELGQVVDTPGIRVSSDSETTQLALNAVAQADTVVFVARASHAAEELQVLFRLVPPESRRLAILLTFEDKASPTLPARLESWKHELGVPVLALNARDADSACQKRLLEALKEARPVLKPLSPDPAPDLVGLTPQKTWFEHPLAGPWLSLAAVMLLFGLPVYLAFEFAMAVQPLVDGAVITPLKGMLEGLPAVPYALLAGNYGILTLGWYSFLWAFPVVLLIGISAALADETGIKDRMVGALDTSARRIGLQGRDLLPVLTGYGCNVVGVFQSRCSSRCTRQATCAMIAFSAACSYQIGASLSLFGAAGHPWLFAPYLLLIFAVGALHTRLWHGRLSTASLEPLTERSFLQRPTWRGVWWRVKTVVSQFLFQAMPIFVGICLVAALLEVAGLLTRLSNLLGPSMMLLGLPAEVAPGIVFSALRKDGLLVLNQGDLLGHLSAGQTLTLVFLASTLTACLVTLWTTFRELGARSALALAGRQMLTSVVATALLALAFRL